MSLLRVALEGIATILRRPRIRQCLDVLPVVRRQLLETNRHVEESVVAVCGSFAGIAARAREAVSDSRTLLEGSPATDGASVEGSIETSRRTITSLLQRMERANALSSMAVASMEEISRTVSGIEDLLEQVERIAFTNKLVALNAKIEAVRVGGLGAGFEVVADEISRQAERSMELAEGIASHIQEMRGRAVRTAEELRSFLAEDRHLLGQSREQADQALDVLLSLNQRMQQSLERNAREHSRLADEIASAIVGLQFQDRVKQRMEHVTGALEQIETALAGKSQQSAAGGVTKDLLSGVHSLYTMQSERDAHNPAMNQVPVEQPDMEVELF